MPGRFRTGRPRLATTRRTARGEQGQSRSDLQFGAVYPLVPRVFRAFRENFPLGLVTLEESGTNTLIDNCERAASLMSVFIRTPGPIRGAGDQSPAR